MSSKISNPVGKRKTAIAMTIAGSDSGGGAGIQADLKTFSALGVYGASAITAITAQNTCAVTAVHNIPGSIVRAQIDAVLQDLDVSAIKIGMLCSAEIIAAVSESLRDFSGPVVLDPVMVAKSGARLLQPEAIDALLNHLLPRVSLITPNLPEAALLLNCKPAGDIEAAVHQGERLLDLGARAVLMKGGHAEGVECIDQLIAADQALRLAVKRIETHCTHGTGCTLSAAIAAQIANGNTLAEAVTSAHAYLQTAIAEAEHLQVGKGHGPVHHFHASWDKSA